MSSDEEGSGDGDERMAFRVTEDDEEFEQHGGFYGGLGSRRRRGMSKEDRIYGVFKGSDDDDDDDGADASRQRARYAQCAHWSPT